MVSIFSASRARISSRSGASCSPRCDRRSVRASIVAAAIFVIGTASTGAIFADLLPDKPAPYVVITKDGHRIDAMEKPAASNDRVKIRLSPSGSLAVLPAVSIDWAATEKFNEVPAMKPAAAPPAAAAAPDPAQTPEAPGRVIEMKIIGGSRVAAAIESAAAEEEAAGSGARAASPNRPADPNASVSILSGLTREIANLRQARAGLLDSKAKLEADIAALEARVGQEPAASGVQDYSSPARKALDRARASLQAIVEQLDPIERRINAVKIQASDLGATLD